MIINQIKNLIDDIEELTNNEEKFIKYIELSKLILLESPQLLESDIKKILSNDKWTDTFYEIQQIGKFTTEFIDNNINFMEDDLKGSDFETEIINTSKNLKISSEKLQSMQKKYNKLLEKQEEYNTILKKINELEDQIKPFEEIDIQFAQNEHKSLQDKFKDLVVTESENLTAYQNQLKANEAVKIECDEVESLSTEIKEKLDLLDSTIKKNL